MDHFLDQWEEAVRVSLGFFWMALWAFILGYVVSAMIQVFVTKERMRRSMGTDSAASIGKATVFGFLSSSCSFAALATTKSLFQKGAGLIPSLAFLVSSTNLVIELGFVIAIFMSWQFVVGEYVGGLLLVGAMWILVRAFRPVKLEKEARKRLGPGTVADQDGNDWRLLIRSRVGWARVGSRFQAEWAMVWKDVTFGFTTAGIIAAFVPSSFFAALFVQSGGHTEPSTFALLEHVLVGPVAAFFTFIGSMGNVPLAALLLSKGVSFAGVMAFLFSDLVVFPVLRINAGYYGWKMALYILAILLVSLVVVSLLLHAGFDLLGLLPERASSGTSVTNQDFFSFDYGFILNLISLGVTALLVRLSRSTRDPESGMQMEMADRGPLDRLLTWLAFGSYAWLATGVALMMFRGG